MAYTTSITCVTVEVLFFLITVVTSALLGYYIYDQVDGIVPFNRGFFCNDKSIMKPFIEKSTISYGDLLKVGVTVCLAMILLLEVEQYIKARQQKESKFVQWTEEKKKCGPLSIPIWIIRMIHRMAIFGSGVAVISIFFDAIKVLSGRLRPHFLAVCKPNTTLFNCSDGYITANVCTGDPLLVKNARLSMPSGHAAWAWYFGLFAAYCVQVMIYIRKCKIFRMVIQAALILLAFGVSLTRITDYVHHWSDVVVGGLIGILFAWLVAVKAIRLLRKEKQNSEYSEVPTDDQPDDEVRLTDTASKEELK